MDGRSLTSPVLRGWDRYTVGLASELVKRGTQVTLFYQEGKPLHPDHVREIGCETVGLHSSKGLQWEQVTLPRALRRGGYDVYHAPAEHGVPWFCPCPAVLTIHSVTWHSYVDLVSSEKLPGKPSDYTGFKPSWKSQFYWNRQVSRADHVFAPSEFSRNEIVRLLKIPAEKVTVTPLGLPHEFCNAPTALTPPLVKKPYLLYVGGYERHKNVNGLLRTFALVHNLRPDVSLVLVGTKNMPPELVSQAEGLGFTRDRDVFFLADLSDELIALYDHAELFVTMSWRESFGLPVLEAMSRGLRVISSTWGAMPEVVGALGTLIDPRDDRAAAQNILDLLQQPITPDDKARLRARAEEFSWSRTADLTLDVYHRLASS